MKKTKDFNYYCSKKYSGMMDRCYREKDISYKNYGMKGIRVCSEWIKDINTFKNFMKNQIKEMNISEQDYIDNARKYQLDRIDPNGHYCPQNCRLISPQENSRNKIKNKKVVISAEGEEIILATNKI